MVHALEMTRSLLKRGGLLVDIHPNGKTSEVEVHVDGEILPAGPIREVRNAEKYFQASAALQNVTGRGLFELEREGQFTFLRHAPTTRALTDYIEAEWSDPKVSEKTIERANELLDRPGKGAGGRKEIVLREIVLIARFRANGR